MTLGTLFKSQQARIVELPTDLLITRQLLEQGFIPNAVVTLAHKAPFRGPMAFSLNGTKICLQRNIANLIQVEPI